MNSFHANGLMNCMAVRVSSEQDISASAPSTLPDSIEEKLVTLPTNGLDTGASVQPAAVGKSSTGVRILNS